MFYRYTVWSDNVERINRRAAATSNTATHRLGLTAHTDLTTEEFRMIYLGAPMTAADRTSHRQQQQELLSVTPPAAHALSSFMRKAHDWLTGHTGGQQPAVAKDDYKKPQHWRYENVTAPPSVDWRQHKPTVLGAIKDQHVNGTPCGSCWAFSAVSIMEIASAMSSGDKGVCTL